MSAQIHAELLQAADKMRTFQRHMELTLAPLQSDMTFALAQMVNDKNNEQFWRRTIIRCLLAYIEALLWNLKHGIPIIASISGAQLTADDLVIIREERTVIVKGKPETRRKYLPFRDNIKATFSLFGKVHKLSFNVNCDHDFDALCKTHDLRSCLMHPKKPFDLGVSNPDFAVSQQGVKWLQQEYGRLMEACAQAILKITQDK